MPNLSSQNSFLNLSPKAEFNATSVNSATSFGENADTTSFLATLVQALDETGEFLPQALKNLNNNEQSVQDLALNFEQSTLLGGEVTPDALFENLNFMQLLGLLDNLQIDTSEVKLANLSTQMQDFLQTQSNLDALKGAKNINELLDLAKNLNLRVLNVKIEQIGELKTLFPNLEKANFFTQAQSKQNQSLEGVFKEFLNTKISSLINEKSTTTKSTNKGANLLSKMLQSLDDDSTKALKNELKSSLQKNAEFIDTAEEIQIKSIKTALENDKTQDKIVNNSEKIAVKSENLSSKISENLTKISINSQINSAKTNEKISTNNEAKNFAQTLNFATLTKETKNQNDFKNTLDEMTNLKEQNIANETKNFQPLNTAKNAEIPTKESVKIPSQESKKEPLKENKESKNSNLKELKSELKNDFKIDEKLIIKDEKSTHKINNNAQNSNEFKIALNSNSSTNSALNSANDKAWQSTLKSWLNKSQTNENKSFISQESIQKTLQNETLTNKENTAFQGVNLENKNPANLENLLSKLQNKISQNSNTQNTTNQGFERQEQNANFDEFKFDFNVDNDNSELNAALKDLSQVSRNELKNEVSVKETFRHFAQDFKEQMQQYKSPITRFNITLHPSNLGEVEVTLVQRGQNLQVNFNTNTNTMNLFVQNQAEFKNSLVNMGFTGLEMNFSDQGKKDRQQQGKNRSGYGFEEEFESLNAPNNTLEFILARYF